MTFLLNTNWGGFRLPDDFLTKYPQFEEARFSWCNDEIRYDPALIAAVREYGIDNCPDLSFVDIPDGCTDWEVSEYDGWESLIYVKDGKIFHA